MEEQGVPNTQHRVLFWDNIKGILILLVVFGHFVLDAEILISNRYSLLKLIWVVIYFFHMPLFAFVSGFFGHKRSGTKDNSSFLLIAYVVLQSLFALYNSVIGTDFNWFIPLYTAWYLLALFVWRKVTDRVTDGRADKKHLFVFFLILALISGLFPLPNRYFAWERVIGFYPFYLLGYLFPTKLINEMRQQNSKVESKIAGGVSIGVGIAIAIGMASLNPSLETLAMGSYTCLTDIIIRLMIYVISVPILLGMILVVPDSPILLLTKAGRNSFSVFFWHRFVILFLDISIMKRLTNISDALLILILLLSSVILLAVFAINPIDRLLRSGLELNRKDNRVGRIICSSILVTALLLQLVPGLLDMCVPKSSQNTVVPNKVDHTTSVLTPKELEDYDDAYRILFAGDLILLEDQVKRAYSEEGYDFSDLFEYTSPYISEADLAIGVLEGPIAGKEPYSIGNFSDGKKLLLNFPREFAEAIEENGFDLVSLANNHMLDCEVEGAMNTMDELERIGLEFVGAYRNEADKMQNRVKFMDVGELKLAFLSYTFNYNYHTDAEMNGKYSYLSSFLFSPESEYFESAKAQVAEDFELAKQSNPDLIVVLPHMGTQFKDYPDEYQQIWCDYFIDCGADIIFSDHTHSVQPMELRQCGDRTVVIENCPGNYTNIFRDYNGDCSIMAEVYVDKTSKKIVGSSIIPMWICAGAEGNYRPIPIYDIMTDPILRRQFTTDDLARVAEVHEHIVSTVLGTEFSVNACRERYYLTASGYVREPADSMEITPKMREGLLYKYFVDANAVCFLGDSVTCGSNNYGYPWYEPIQDIINGDITNLALPGATVNTLLGFEEEIRALSNCDLFVIAIGTNDIRYRDETTCAMTSETYINELGDLCQIIKETNPNATIAFITPWTSCDGDRNSKLLYSEVVNLRQEYSNALGEFCETNGYLFVDANPYIESVLSREPESSYLEDWIHPNALHGIYLYSEAVLSYCNN